MGGQKWFNVILPLSLTKAAKHGEIQIKILLESGQGFFRSEGESRARGKSELFDLRKVNAIYETK